MNRKWMIAAIALLVAGALICAVSLATLGFDFKKLNTVTYTTNTYELTDGFRNISVKADAADIRFLPAENGVCTVVCHEDEKDTHSVRVEGDTLVIEKDRKSIWQFINFGFWTDSASVTVYLPETVYGTLDIDASTGDAEIPAGFTFDSIHADLSTGDISCRASATGEMTFRTSTGDVDIADLSAREISVKTSTGDIRAAGITCTDGMKLSVSNGKTTLEDITCGSLISTGSTGRIEMTRVVALGEMRIERDTGSVVFDGCDADSIYVETDTGNVTGTLLTEKIFYTETDTGHVDVPKSMSGGRCEVSTDTGDIRIRIGQ